MKVLFALAKRTIYPKIVLQDYLTKRQRISISINYDPVRYGSIYLAIEQLKKESISGQVAECGVFKGVTSKFLHENMPDRKLFLFDTFEGFSNQDTDNYLASDQRFKDTSVRGVLNYIGDENNIIIKQGFFPNTTVGMETEQFAFVMLDFDKYEPTLAGLNFFYPRLSPGGYIFIHDYNNPESNWACSRAVNFFLQDKQEKLLTIPDAWGSALFRKI